MQRTRPVRLERTRCATALLAFCAIAASAPVSAALQDVEDPPEASLETTAFSVPDTLLVRALFERARGHVDARRFGEAITDLQTILEQHSGDVLPAERPKTNSGRASENDVHPGATQRARAVLLGLPQDARTIYRNRYEADAAAALAAARAANDVRALAEVGRRWPLTESGVRADLALGDLEFECGHEREAAFAWARGLASYLFDPNLSLRSNEDWTAVRARLAAKSSGDAFAGLLRRIDVVIARPPARALAEALADNEQSLRLPNSRAVTGPPPGENGDAWAKPFALPSHPFRESARDLLFAVRSGESLFVSTSLRLFALHAYTGEMLWDSDEPSGWSSLSDKERTDLFTGVDKDAMLIAPAASDSVVVAALQLPFALLRNDTYQQIQITRPIPERRLFAYDVATGRKLWDHTPPKGWDGEGGTFAERRTIAGPPVIVGTRVLAPCVLMQGRIDYSVGCFDRDTGNLIWSQHVVSGQREQNMFGRAEHEFSAAPLCVEGDKVIALTQLGTVACLDLFTGEILWETLYDTIAIPRARTFNAPKFNPVWRNCAPIVEGNVVLATPFNSRDLLALDLDSGALLWSQGQKAIDDLCGTPTATVDLLLGTTRDAIFMGGDRWVALDMPAGVGERSRLRAKAAAREDDLLAVRSRTGRPLLAEDRVIVPRISARVDFDRTTGSTVATVPWPNARGGGNILLGVGEMFVVSPREVRGLFEWDVLVDRARAELTRVPTDSARVLKLARLLDGRGASEWQRGTSDAARAHFAEARAILERALRENSDDAKPELNRAYHNVLRGEARVRASLADSNGALADLRAARANAPSLTALRDTLIEEYAILRERMSTPGADAPALFSVLSELERSCAALPLLVHSTTPSDGASVPFGAELEPKIGSRADDEAIPIELPVGLFVLMQRDAWHARSGDVQAEFVDLHSIIESYSDVEVLVSTAAEMAAARIEDLRAHGHDAGYEVFEARAQSLLQEAVLAHDDATLMRVAKLFPTSRAARAANDARLALALEKGDLHTVLGIVRSELPENWRPENATAAEVQRLLRLASALGRAQNREAEGALLRALAAQHGDLVSDLPEHAGQTLAALARSAPQFEHATKALDAGRFTTALDSASERPWPGEFELLGETLPSVPVQEIEAGRPETLVFASISRSTIREAQYLMALSSSDPTAEAWALALPPDIQPPASGNGVWTRRSTFAAGRLLLATTESVLGFDTDKGERAFEWRPSGGVPDSMSINSSSGIAIVIVTNRGERDRWSVVALDAHSGTELWRANVGDANVQRIPLLSERRVVFVPSAGGKQVVVLDLFTGARAERFDLDTAVVPGVDSDAWIQGETLVVPWFNELRVPERNHVLCMDLASGKRAWRVSFEDPAARRWLSGVLQQGERTWLVVQSQPNGESTPPEQNLFALDARIGAVTPLSSIRVGPEDRVLGLPRASRVVLTKGPIALTSPRAGGGRGALREVRVRCIDLDRGELWVQSLGIGFDELAPGVSPQPALSDTTLAVVVATNETPGRMAGSNATLYSFDVKTGLAGGSRFLRRMDTKDIPQLSPLGATLVVRTKSQLEILK